jgi:hypothetical protein
MQEVDAETLLKEPLGSTSDCLSVDEIASYDSLLQTIWEKDEFSTERDIRALDNHLSSCEECQKNLKLYRALELQTKELPELETEQNELIASIHEEEVPNILQGSEAEYKCHVMVEGGPPGEVLTVDESTVSLHGSFYSSQRNTINTTLQPVEPGDSLTFSASFQINFGKPFEGKARSLCDWLEISGKTTSGRSFRARSLKCFKRS